MLLCPPLQDDVFLLSRWIIVPKLGRHMFNDVLIWGAGSPPSDWYWVGNFMFFHVLFPFVFTLHLLYLSRSPFFPVFFLRSIRSHLGLVTQVRLYFIGTG